LKILKNIKTSKFLKIKSMSFYGLLRFNFKKRRAKSIEKKISFMAAD